MSKESGKFEPMETLLPEDVTVGSIVLYQATKDKVWPAIVTKTHNESAVSLHVFHGNTSWPGVVGVDYDIKGKPNTWRWEL